MKKWKKKISLLLVFCVLFSLLPQFALAGAELESEQAIINTSAYPAPGAIVTYTGTVGVGGAPWQLYSDGTVMVGEGIIHWTGGNWSALPRSPWYEHRYSVDRIIFTGPIIGGPSLVGLFIHLSNVHTLEGLHYFDTSNVTNMFAVFWGATQITSLDLSAWNTSNVANMFAMFWGTTRITSLDLSTWSTNNVTDMSGMFSGMVSLRDLDVSGWETSNVTDMSGMFSNTLSLKNLDISDFDTSNVANMHDMFSNAGLESLDLSNWDIRNVTNMGNMFSRADSLRQIALGEQFIFRLSRAQGIWVPDESPPYDDARLTSPPQNDDYTGYWQNVGSGTINNPAGEFVFTSAELMANFDGSTMADTWVWQPRNPTPSSHPFTDVQGHWANDAIQYVYENNLMTGTTSTTFVPDGTLSRAMLATILWRLEGEPAVTFRSVFSDVPSNAPAWYRTAVIWANENGIVQGFDGHFNPYGEITREQFATMLYRYAQFTDGDVSVSETFNLDNFHDHTELSDWAEDAMYWANYHGLITGTTSTTLVPIGTTTRAQAATILARFMSTLGG